MIRQTLALLLDAYRDLNARKMFWITLILSGLVVLAFAAVGINERGITVLWFEFQSFFNTRLIDRASFYKSMFSGFGVGTWLTWAGMILALVSTASIIPDFIAGGSVDLYLSKPIGRFRLFLTKYLTGLLFVTLQVLIFSLASFFVIGIRGGAWEPRVFLAIPVVVLVFSFLYCMCALIGVLTRSTIAALLLTVLFWLLIFGVDAAEKVLLMARTAGEIESTAYVNRLQYLGKEIALAQEKLDQGDATAKEQFDRVTGSRTELEAKKKRTDPARENIATAHKILYTVKSILPKTAESTGLLERWLNIKSEDLEEVRIERHEQRHSNGKGGGGLFRGFADRTEVRIDDAEVTRTVVRTMRSRPASWVMGTSVAFEAVIVLLAAWVFCRRDF